MTRKDFLFYVGLFILALTGISHIMKSITEVITPHTPQPSFGFGSGPYGGTQQRGNQ